MADQPIELIPVENLFIDLFNPRHEHQASQRDAISIIAHDQGIKLVNLAEDIVDKGLNPSDLPLVTPADQEGMYIVLEGNRRVAALKLLGSPQFLTSIDLPGNLDARYRALQARVGQSIPTAINCAVVEREDSTHWINLKHTGENKGVGIVPWDGIATDRFRGSSPALQAVQMVGRSDYIDDETKKNLPKISITNVDRVLRTPEARRTLGFDIRDDKLIIVAPNEEEALARLAILVRQVANKEVKVTDLDSKEQRVAYAHRVAAMPPTVKVAPGASGTSPTAVKPGAGRRISPYRKTLIPRDFKVTIHQTRINQIFHELQKLNVDEYRNCCAVMLRVFIEQSVDQYGETKKVSLKTTPKAKPGAPPPKDVEMPLRDKLTTVANHLENSGVCNKDQLRGVRSLVANRLHVLSVDGLNAYVHNKDYNPAASDLKTNWDSIQPFVQALWSA